MKTKHQREIVIEFEKVQLIRKRARTTVDHCDRCNASSDFVSLGTAAELFGITVDDLAQFVVNAAVHYAERSLVTAICIPSLLTIMQEKQGNTPKLIRCDWTAHDDGSAEQIK